MPDHRQQDQRLNRDELESYRYSVALVEVQSGVAMQLTNIFTNFCNNGINVVFPREILINKNAQVFYKDFRLKTNIIILFIIKHAMSWLVSKSLLVWMRTQRVDFLMLKQMLKVSLLALNQLKLEGFFSSMLTIVLRFFTFLSVYRMSVSSAKR